MTLRDLQKRLAADPEDDQPLTYRQVANVTGEEYALIRKWVSAGKLPVVLYGPSRSPRVLASVVVKMFAPAELPMRPVRVIPSHYVPCGPKP